MNLKLNTSNPDKLKEFRQHLGEINAIKKDLDEPDSDIITIIRYKASQFENTIVDDTSLHIDGETVGANIKWLLDDLPKYVNKKATFTCLLAIHRNNQVEIYKGETVGRISEPRGNSFGFNNYFLPNGTDKTFGEEIPDQLNPRYLAIQNFKAAKTFAIEAPLKIWTGEFQ